MACVTSLTWLLGGSCGRPWQKTDQNDHFLSLYQTLPPPQLSNITNFVKAGPPLRGHLSRYWGTWTPSDHRQILRPPIDPPHLRAVLIPQPHSQHCYFKGGLQHLPPSRFNCIPTDLDQTNFLPLAFVGRWSIPDTWALEQPSHIVKPPAPQLPLTPPSPSPEEPPLLQ